ncbi:putative ferric-chelate reductase 1 [Tripterygium wilfordii]|uniref:Putative ferric-chelate reductase 1 n=1 Tax=Tripterygium wilfordii TaxID=458696 RepID=A0A7J7BXA7_TRIWF|nr:cytochrome b561 and DOMON domain-containing protein At3g07570-like [Tripterygium wilfordii]KAF5726512.1 putative ferric-chelate reductase 1 [Tripterygium wilfordii]
MKPSSMSMPIFIFHLLYTLLTTTDSQTDSCTSNLNLNGVAFDITNLQCLAVWTPRNFLLRYGQASSDIWSFILSAPDSNSYTAIGFSSNGQMVGSSAIVGWISNGAGTMKQYYLGGQSSSLVLPDQGNLSIISNSTIIVSQSSRVYMAFQLNTNQPQTRVLYAVGTTGSLPAAPSYMLTEHVDKVSTTLNYVTGQGTKSGSPHSRLRNSHGMVNILGWGIAMLIGVIVAR